MTRSLAAFVFAALFPSVAAAGPLPVVKRDAVQSSAPKYLVSANLNKLVFWHVPSRDDGHPQR